jgi:hypothetical protein
MQFLCPFVCISCTRHTEYAVCSRAKSYLYIYTRRSHPTDKNKPTFVYWEYFYFMCIHCSSSVSVSPLCGHEILDSLRLCSPVVYNIDFECGFQKRSEGISDHCYQVVAFADHFLGTCSVEVLRLNKQDPKFSAGEFFALKVGVRGGSWVKLRRTLARARCLFWWVQQTTESKVHTRCCFDSMLSWLVHNLYYCNPEGHSWLSSTDNAKRLNLLHWKTHRQGRARSIACNVMSCEYVAKSYLNVSPGHASI